MESRKILIYLAMIYEGDWEKIYSAISSKETIDEKIAEKYCEKVHSKVVTILDDNYPECLKYIFRPPFVIFYHGNLKLIKDKYKSISVVGSRKNTGYGHDATNTLVSELCKELVVVSGMALGIDGIAHRTAIRNGGKTVAVLGCGINVCYPGTNLDIYEECKKNHLVISEYPDLTKPHPLKFPIRNRIIAGLSDCLLIIEGKKNSGTSITATCMLENGGNVCCVPTRIGEDSLCNDLISHGARLVETANDVYNEMNYIPKSPIFEK